MAYISFINVWISAKSSIWELFQNIGVSVTNTSHSSGACVSLALFPWLNVFSKSFYLLWQTQSYHSLNVRTLKVLLTLWMVERLKRKRPTITITPWSYFEHWACTNVYELFTCIVSQGHFVWCWQMHFTAGHGRTKSLQRAFKEKQKTVPTIWQVDLVH